MHPIAYREDHVARPLDGGLVVLSPDRSVHHLDAVAAYVWSHADGTQSAAQLTEGLRASGHADATSTLVFEALDRLADAKLLSQRAAPPSGVSRRAMLRRLTGGAALAALTAVVGLPESALAAAGGVCGDDKALIEEIAWLEAEASGVAELLDTWIDEAEDQTEKALTTKATLDTATKADTTGSDDAVDEVYLAALNKRERYYKYLAAKRHLLRADATEDLAECTTAKKKHHAEERVKARELHYKKRQEQSHKSSARHLERHKKRQVAYRAREKSRKAQLQNNEALSKKKLAHKPTQLKESQLRHEERAKRELVHHKARTLRHERRLKHVKSHSEQRTKHIAVRRERGLKHTKSQLVTFQERADIQAEALASRKLEQASKDKGVKDRVREIAQEEALKAQALSHQEKKHKSAQEQKYKSVG